MSPEERPDDAPRREKENMDEPQEEFIDPSSIPSRPKPQEPEKKESADSGKRK
jgi:hypothetical protein